MEQNENLREKFLGPAVELDASESNIYSLYWLLRRGTPSDRGIPITLRDLHDYDPLLLDLLMVADSTFMEELAEAREESMRKAKSQPLSRKVTRHG